MAAKETIALVGIDPGSYTGLIYKLAKENYRLLLVSDNAYALEQLSGQVRIAAPDAEVEAIDCVKNGCWEADIIVLAGPGSFEEELIERIRVFTTQKILVGISVAHDKAPAFEAKDIQQLLPDTKVVHVFITSGSGEAFIAGDDREAVDTIYDMTFKAGYSPVVVDSFKAITDR